MASFPETYNVSRWSFTRGSTCKASTVPYERLSHMEIRLYFITGGP